MKDFPAGPVAKNLCCHCRGHGFDPWSGNYNPTCYVALPKKNKSMKTVSVHLVLVVKNLPANVGDIRDENSILGSGRSPGEGHSNPLQYSCLENPMNRGAWWATVHRVAQSWAQLKWLNTHTYVCMEAGSRVRDKNCSPNYPLLRIDAFKLWYCRRLLIVPWTARSSNQSILKEISPGCSLEGMMLKLKLQYFCHLMQSVGSLEKTLMLGGIGSRRKKGQQDEMAGWHHQLDGRGFG